MSERIVVPGLAQDEQGTLDQLLTQLAAKTERNELRSEYVDCSHAVRRYSSIIPPQYYRLGIVLGWTGRAIDIPTRRVDLQGFTWADGDAAALGLDQLTEDNWFFGEFAAGVRACLQHGVSFLINTRGVAPEPVSLIHVKDALNATGVWNARRRALDSAVSVVSRTEGKPSELAIYLDGLTITCAKNAGRWSVSDRQTHPWGVPVEPLAYRPRLDRPFGSSRLTRAMLGLQDQAVRALIRLEAHDDIYAIPDLWLLGATESIFKNADGSDKAAWQVVMGRIKGVPDDPEAEGSLGRADVKQFPASSPEPHLASLNAFAKLFAREASLPDSSIAIADMANPTSAEAYDAAQHELIAEIEGAERDWVPPLRRCMLRALAINNALSVIPRQWATIAPTWRNPRYLSRAAEADAGAKQLSVATWLADTEIGLELLGLRPDQIKRAMGEKDRRRGAEALAAIRANAAAARTPPPPPGPATATAPAPAVSPAGGPDARAS